MRRGLSTGRRAALVLVCWVGLAGLIRPASAETHRVAVVVGNNAGHGERPPLRYAEGDAGKLAQTLIELGGVETPDLFLLQGRPLSALREVLELAKEKVSGWHRSAEARVVLLFYFSGHSDGAALELGRDLLPFAELRQWLSATGAEVKVAIIDSCKSGALLAAKGGRPGPAFQIRLTDDLMSTGEALLTASAADELALESREIRGSFFTHHLVSGLRGAADSSGDGNVTLAEAYQYAFAHTVTATAGVLIGAQHPGYDYRLSGQGELVLSVLSKPSALLELPSGFERLLVIHLLRDQVLAELPSGAAVRLALPPGRYAVQAWRKGQIFAGRFEVRAGASYTVLPHELVAVPNAAASPKGDSGRAQTPSRPIYSGPALLLAPGIQGGVANSVGALGSLRLGVRSFRPSGWSVAADLSTGRGDIFWETSALLFVGYRLGLSRGRFAGFLGLEAGGGIIAQNLDSGIAQRSGTVAGAPWLGGSLHLSGRLSLALETHVPIGWIRRDGMDVLLVLPAGWLGLLVQI